MESNEFQKRLRRSVSLDGEIHVVSDDPVVLEYDSPDNDDTYTLVPNTAYCGCPDARYRGYPCKHLLAILTDSVETSDTVRETLADAVHRKADERLDEAEEMVSEAEQAHDQAAVWADADRLTPINVDHSAEQDGRNGQDRRDPEDLDRDGRPPQEDDRDSENPADVDDDYDSQTGTIDDFDDNGTSDRATGDLARVITSVTTDSNRSL